MSESNLAFRSNVNIINSTSTSIGDKVFLNKITDPDALKKLLHGPCEGYTNSTYYMFPYRQTLLMHQETTKNGVLLDPEKIRAKNQEMDVQYGYSDYDENKLFKIIGELYLEYGDSIWKKDPVFWWKKKGFFGENGNSAIGRWVVAGSQLGTVEPSGGGTFFTSFVKQEIQRAHVGKDQYVPVGESFDELYEPDPYYYYYQKTAGVSTDDVTKSADTNKEASTYLQAYSIYNAFELVEQNQVIEAAPSVNTFVDAGPGTGKTYTLIEKINYMVEKQGVDPSGIMVLCFTNAAVAEIKKRREEYVEAGGSRGLRNVDIRTFHSFAWWLINEANNELTEEGWAPVALSSLSYDGSIVRATGIIRRFSDIILGGWEHFIVDEIQDLTDVRARLVLEIVKGCLKNGCGITVFGDSCQAIYDYNQEETVDPMTSTKFYRSLFNILYGKASFCKFGFNHRQVEDLKKMTVDLREAILNEKIPEMKSATQALYQQMSHVNGSFIDVAVLGGLDSIAGDGKVCLLCRNNAQVLGLSASLRQRGISHMVNAYDRTGCFAAWIGRIFSGYKNAKISKDDFISLFGTDCDHTILAENAWDTLSALLKKENNMSLGVSEILGAIYSSEIDDPIFHNIYDSNIIVSNIHKAKGREYSGVIVEENFIKRLTGNRKKEIGEFKTLYVAVTRPKQKLYTANMVSSNGVRVLPVFATGRKRWGKYTNHELKYLEIQGNADIDVDSFNQNGSDVQKYLSDKVHIGDEIVLRKSKPGELLRYNIVHVHEDEETVIGCCTHVFEADLEGLLQTKDSFQWPREIRNLYVSDVYSHIDKAIIDNQSDYVGDKVWNWVDFCGLGRLVFDAY